MRPVAERTWIILLAGLLALVAVGVLAQEVLPAPPAPFTGQVGLSVKDSSPTSPSRSRRPRGRPTSC